MAMFFKRTSRSCVAGSAYRKINPSGARQTQNVGLAGRRYSALYRCGLPRLHFAMPRLFGFSPVVALLALTMIFSGCTHPAETPPAPVATAKRVEAPSGKIAFRELVANRALFAGGVYETTFEIHGIVPDEAGPGRLIAVALPSPELDPETKRLMIQRAPTPVIAVLDASHLAELSAYHAVVLTATVRLPESPTSLEVLVEKYKIRANFPKGLPDPKTVKVFE